MLKWRNNCPEVLLTRIENAVQARFYILRQTGPTAFLVKEHDSEKQFRVCLGSIHSCDCSLFLKEKELCMHLLWILIKKFRIPKDDQVVYQLGLCERELDNVIYGRKEAESRKIIKTTSAGTGRSVLNPKVVDKDDVCPICQEDIFKSKKNLIYCRFGCGNSVHLNCMKIWADHQFQSFKEEMIKCPLCRTEFANYKAILHDYNKVLARKKLKRIVPMCQKCKVKINAAIHFRCSVCTDLSLCLECFQTNYHTEHSFVSRKSAKDSWNHVSRLTKDLSLQPSVSNLCLPDRLENREGQANKLTVSKFPQAVPGRRRTSSHSAPQPDLRNLSFGIHGLQLKRQNKEKQKSEIRFPPLPSNRLVANISPSTQNRKSRVRMKSIPNLDHTEMVVTSVPLSFCRKNDIQS